MKTIPRLIFLLWFSSTAFALEVEDDAGQSVILEKTAQRIVTLSPHATELVFAAGAGNQIIGTTAFSNYPPAAKNIPLIGDALHLDREQILLLKPDLVIAWATGNKTEDIIWLTDNHIAVYKSNPVKLEDIAENIIEIGTLSGQTEKARHSAAQFTQRLEKLKRQTRTSSTPSVFYQLWDKPLMTINGKSIISEIISLCGGKNLFADLGQLSAEISREAVIQRNPDVIIAALDAGRSTDPFSLWRPWKNLSAVMNNRLHTLPSDSIHRPTPRILEGAERICQALQARP